jgi:two-component system cell cycle sensor histidine kinase/response regulator CckA
MQKMIILAEDFDLVREVLMTALAKKGYAVISAENGLVLLDKILQATQDDPSFKPDLLLTDIEMPGISGRELAERVREQFPGLPVVFMSGNPNNRQKFELDKVSPHFFVKPSPTMVEDLDRALAAAFGS